jgi:TetR/AcrR family transcriptional regulator, ethionamide resistance regulator
MEGATKTPAAAAGARGSGRRRREQARERVVRAALELSEGGSFGELTVDQIARAAGISRSAFYIHFHDKQELLGVAVEAVSEDLYRMAEGWWHGEGPPGERVRRAIEGVVSVYAEHATLLRIASEASSYDEDVRAQWMGIAERFIEAAAKHIGSEQGAGLIPESLDARSTAEALYWMAERYCYVYLGRGERTPEQVVEGLAPVWTATLYPGVIPADQLRPGGHQAAAPRSEGRSP